MTALDKSTPRYAALTIARMVFEMKTVIWRSSEYPGETLEQAWLRKYGEAMPTETRLEFNYQGRRLRFLGKGRLTVTGGKLPNDEIRELPTSGAAGGATMLEDKIVHIGITLADELGKMLFGPAAE